MSLSRGTVKAAPLIAGVTIVTKKPRPRETRSTFATERHADRRRYEQVIEKYLRECYARRTVARVSELAQLLDAPRARLSRIVPRLFGRPLGQILREKQLAEAKRLLRLTPLRVDEIAAASAFGDRSTLYRLFRKATGMTPDEYRKKVTNCDFTEQ